MKFTDTHCHLYLDQFSEEIDTVMQRAADSGVESIFLPAIDWDSHGGMVRLQHPDITFHKMVGIHPCHVMENRPLDEERLFSLAKSEEYVAVGETGLDYYWDKESAAEQKESLTVHCKVAKSVKKPIVLHNRESTADLLDLIEQEQDGALRGIWHCFTGSLEEGRRALDLGLFLGVGGVLTFKNSNVDEVVRQLPLDRIVLETDAPYLAPAPKRGKRNEPSYIVHTARKLADTLGLPLEEVARVTSENAAGLFAPET